MGFFEKKQKWECEECKEKFFRRNEVIQHGVEKHNLKVNQCTLCDLPFLYVKGLKRHLDEEHSKVSLPWRLFFSWCPLAYIAIDKFFPSLLLVIGFGIIATVITVQIGSFFSVNTSFEEDSRILFFVIIYYGIPFSGMFYFMRKWATEWNNKIDELHTSLPGEKTFSSANEPKNLHHEKISPAQNKSKLHLMMENKVRMVTTLQENNLGDYDRLENIKKDLIDSGTFTEESNDYLEENYEEYKKITRANEENTD